MLSTRFSRMTEGCVLCPSAFDGKCLLKTELPLSKLGVSFYTDATGRGVWR
jgi:hypothetical protein